MNTVHVNLSREPAWGGVGIPTDGSILRGLPVRHEAANIQCNAVIGKRRDPESGVVYHLRCKKRAMHEQPKNEKAHVPEDVRIVASPPRISRTRRFAPSGIPAGVNLDVTAPHDCANHLKDVEDVARGF